jgi:carboxypeptidase C (cathepsin A)
MHLGIVLGAVVALAIVVTAQLPPVFYSGYVKVNAQYDANLFYYMVPSQTAPATDPVILWLQGGPGCSSLFGSWVENGPFLIQKDKSFQANPYTWNKNATMIWIDSPVGTGFSFVRGEDYASDEKTIAGDLYTTVSSILFNIKPQFAANPFFIFGESYAGKYVPYLATTILQNNNSPKNKKINLKGIAIGDGWVDPYIQTGSYAPFLYRHDLIGEVALEIAAADYDAYKGAVDAGLFSVAATIGNALLDGLMGDAGLGDPYDIRKGSDPTDPLANRLGNWLNQEKTKGLLNVSAKQEWGLCDTGPYVALMSDIDRASINLLPSILAKIPVMLYNGNYDLICNMDGTATYSSEMVWPGQSAFNSATNRTWNGPNGPAGYFQSAQGLVRLVINNAGHMVPYDQPANSQYMVWAYLTGQLF